MYTLVYSINNEPNPETIYINLTNKGAPGQSFLLEVEVSGTYTGTKKIYSQTHTSDDGEIALDVYGYGEVMLKVYIDKEFDSSLKKAETDLTGKKIKVPDVETDVICEKCGRKMVVKSGRFGKFLACPGYPECKFTKPLVEEMPGRCPKCGF